MILTAYNSESFPCRACLSDSTRICKLALTEVCFSSKRVEAAKAEVQVPGLLVTN